MINSKNNAPTADSFRISMLLYDTRYRSMTIQIIALGRGYFRPVLAGWQRL